MDTVAVIDYGMGNLHSVAKAMEHVSSKTKVLVSSDPSTILAADRVILPGVGAIKDCVAEIKRLGFDEVVQQVAKQKPLLGICVGMQALLDHSEENNGVECLGILPGKVKHFNHLIANPGVDMKIPHMGWNQVSHNDHSLWQGIAQQSRFYFVHSYFVECEHSVAQSNYGGDFSAAVAKDNIFAVQFHPEKSQAAGLQLLANFLAWKI